MNIYAKSEFITHSVRLSDVLHVLVSALAKCLKALPWSRDLWFWPWPWSGPRRCRPWPWGLSPWP